MQAPEAPSNTAASDLYDTDFYAWTQQQAALLHRHQWHQLDVPNLVEEITALGKQQRQELRNRLSVLIGHLLKWQFQPDRRSRSWLSTIRLQRLDIADLLADNPSLQPYLETAVQAAYSRSVALAIGETDLPDRAFPPECPYSLAETLDDRFYPGAAEELGNPL